MLSPVPRPRGSSPWGASAANPVAVPPSQQHTGAVLPVWAEGPRAVRVLGTNDHADLNDDGPAVNHKRVARVKRPFQVQGPRLRRRVTTTIADPATVKAPARIGRDFTALGINQHYVGNKVGQVASTFATPPDKVG